MYKIKQKSKDRCCQTVGLNVVDKILYTHFLYRLKN